MFSKHKAYCFNLIKQSLKFKKHYKTKWKANGPTLESKLGSSMTVNSYVDFW